MIEPAVDRHRGFTAVLVHLRSGSPPSPDGRRYNRLAAGDPASRLAISSRCKTGAAATERAARPRRRPAGRTTAAAGPSRHQR